MVIIAVTPGTSPRSVPIAIGAALARTVGMSHPGAMRTHVLSLLAASTLVACTSGSGVQSKEERTPGAFESLEIQGPFQVDVQVGAATTIAITGDDNVVPKVRSELQGSTLHIDLPGRVVTKLPLKVSIATPTLVDLDVGGACTVDVAGISGARFDVDVSGASEVTLRGETTDLDAEISGASRLHATELTASKVEVDASGASKAEVTANSSVDAEASGSSKVRVLGDPAEVSQDVSGASTIEVGG